MKLVFFAHPSFLGSQSMMRFTLMLSKGMQQRGHDTQIWSPKAKFFNLPFPQFIKKWMGYIDQYVVFKFEVWKKLKQCPTDTVFVFTDQALGPWVPWIGKKPHAIHTHDFLAQKSALGQIKENPTKWSGRQYQSYIRRGYQQGKNFISVSEKTRSELHSFLPKKPLVSEVVYNGLNQSFYPGNADDARTLLGSKTAIDLSNGYLLHVGGNQWYKNRVGVIEIYNSFRSSNDINLPLLLIGQEPGPDLLAAYQGSKFNKDIHFLLNIEDELLKVAYVGASVFVFPSLAEGFGWPIAEAMASGCPVITTNEAPMSEVAGEAGFLIPRMPNQKNEMEAWAIQAAKVVTTIIELSVEERNSAVIRGLENSKRFDPEVALNKIEHIYYVALNH